MLVVATLNRGCNDNPDVVMAMALVSITNIVGRGAFVRSWRAHVG